MNKKVLGLLGTGHAATDVNQGALPIILTFLQPVLMLSQLQIGMVMLSFNLSSSVIQPAFGIFSDRFSAAWLIPAVVFGQELLPNNTGLAAGLTMGFGIGMGGVGATFLGWIADNWGLFSIFGVMTFFPLIGLLLALFLPGREKLAAVKQHM